MVDDPSRRRRSPRRKTKPPTPTLPVPPDSPLPSSQIQPLPLSQAALGSQTIPPPFYQSRSRPESPNKSERSKKSGDGKTSTRREGKNVNKPFDVKYLTLQDLESAHPPVSVMTMTEFKQTYQSTDLPQSVRDLYNNLMAMQSSGIPPELQVEGFWCPG